MRSRLLAFHKLCHLAAISAVCILLYRMCLGTGSDIRWTLPVSPRCQLCLPEPVQREYIFGCSRRS